jgi:TfoX/Sxy family transcriptional regulator of competence genes
MSTDQLFVDHLASQAEFGSALTYKKMFGEFAIYLHGKVVGFACNNQFFLKPTDAGRVFLKQVHEHPAYPGSKLYFRLDAEVEDRHLLHQAIKVTADALPAPKPKVRKKPK